VYIEITDNWNIKIRDLSISELDRSSWLKAQSPKSVISLAKKYHVVKWLNDAYMKLVQQDSLTLHELRANPALDWETTAKLLSVKLAYLCPAPAEPVGFGSPDSESEAMGHFWCSESVPAESVGFDSTYYIYQSNVEKEFREEFENMRSKASVLRNL
jgi:hypothetical protein